MVSMPRDVMIASAEEGLILAGIMTSCQLTVTPAALDSTMQLTSDMVLHFQGVVNPSEPNTCTCPPCACTAHLCLSSLLRLDVPRNMGPDDPYQSTNLMMCPETTDVTSVELGPTGRDQRIVGRSLGTQLSR